jgi:hypothetical protein
MLATALLATGALGDNISIDDGDKPTRRCADLNVRFDRRPTARDEQKLSVSASEGRPLRLRPDTNGGVVVWGGAGPDYAITVCRIASGDTQAEAAALLGSIEAQAAAGEVTLSGPRGGRWTAFLLVSAPEGASLDVEVQNGPVSFDDVSGTVLARAQNGPVSLEGVSGSVDVTTRNGPIHVEHGGGDYKLRADNGPISVELRQAHWDGHLQGSTQNGPLSLELPRGYASGLRIETSSWAPSSCDAAVCEGARWQKNGRGRVLEVGTGRPAVSLSTVNGPLSVSDSGS